MITIIHGDDIASSRTFLSELRQKYPEGVLLNGDSLTLTDLTQVMEGGGLFITEKTIFIEHLFNKKKSPKEFEALTSYIQDQTLEHEIFLWEGKELEKKSLSLFRHATVKTYKLPQTLFLFLDSLKPGNGKDLVRLLHRVLTSTESEMIFFMLVRQVRLLLALREKSSQQIDEVNRLQPWQASKLQKQASLFAIDELLTLHASLFKLDKELKTGELPVDLTVAIDILLIDI